MSQDLRQLPEGNLVREMFEASRPKLPVENEVSMAEKVAAEKRRLAGVFESVGTDR
jgi:hypothetical protein